MWDENKIKMSPDELPSEEQIIEMSELALDILTLAYMHTLSVAEFKKAITELSKDELNSNNRAKVIAWERTSMSILGLTKKSLEEMYSTNKHFRKVVDDRWNGTVQIVTETIPLVKMMVESEMAEIPNIYKFVKENDILNGDDE
jgi:hypothetical protein